MGTGPISGSSHLMFLAVRSELAHFAVPGSLTLAVRSGETALLLTVTVTTMLRARIAVSGAASANEVSEEVRRMLAAERTAEQ